jgi:hypothetical protein
MSLRLSHAAQLVANRTLTQHLSHSVQDPALADVCRQWQVTLYFYAAVHHVELQLQAKRYPASVTHQMRKQRMRQVWGRTALAALAAYLDLEHASRRARYDGWVPSDHELTDAETNLTQILSDIA